MKRQGAIYLKSDGTGQKATFSEVFPEIETLDAEISETGAGNQGLGVRKLNRNSYREFINCSNVDCSGHGLPTGNILRKMVERNESSFQTEQLCEGHDEAGRPCSNIFQISVTLKFRAL